MSKRRLSNSQVRRIKKQQQASLDRVDASSSVDETALGPEQFGRVVAHYGTQVDIENIDESGNVRPSEGKPSTRRCFLRANLEAVVTGDRVAWRDGPDAGVVVSCQPRQSLLSRPDSFGKLKPVAANVDQIIVTIAPKPEIFTNLIDRYLVIAEVNNIQPIILINKMDLIDETCRTFFEQLSALYTGLGYQVLKISSNLPASLELLKSCLANRTSIFVGQSGVGKSSIIKGLLPDQNIAIGQLSEAKTKGRHTTTNSQLFHFAEGGECIDSPGIREFGLWHLAPDEVIQGFIELRTLAERCKFRDCRHQGEPGCAVKQALLEHSISSERLESFQRIVASLDQVNVKPAL